MAITIGSSGNFQAVEPVTVTSEEEPNGLVGYALVVSGVQPDGTPVDSTDALSAIGTPGDAAWDGVAASATVISLLKAIAANTAP
jgi:hypothetical protein